MAVRRVTNARSDCSPQSDGNGVSDLEVLPTHGAREVPMVGEALDSGTFSYRQGTREFGMAEGAAFAIGTTRDGRGWLIPTQASEEACFAAA